MITTLSQNNKKRVVIHIPAYNKPVHYSDLEIHQEILNHSRFEFLWRISSRLMTDPLQDFGYFQNHLDNEITFSFFTEAGKRVLYKGLITGLEMVNKDGSTRGYRVTGHSHTIAMNDLKHNRQHLNKTLADIARDTMKGHIQGLWEPEHMTPEYKAVLPNSLQSDETDWEYMTRLAKKYGEWFYWDGTRLQFGRLEQSKLVLVNGVDLRDFGMKAELISNKAGISGYDYTQATQVKSELEFTTAHFSDDLMEHAIRSQRSQYARNFKEDLPFHNYDPSAKNRQDIEQMTRLATAGKAARMITYTATTRRPINIGQIITIQNKTVSHAIIVTKCSFYSEGTGNFTNKLEGIPADCIHPPYTDPTVRGFAYDQPARVIDNNDPQGMGRVIIEYFWSERSRENISDWLRVQTPHSGKGKGFYFIPEIGEEVRVCFEGGNPDAPYISGTNYNGQNSSGYATAGNDKKVIHTRSGTKIVFNDAQGSVFIEDSGGSTWLMDGQGNISINAPETMSLKAKNMIVNVTEDLVTQVGKNEFKGVEMKQATRIGEEAEIFVAGTFTEIIEGDVISETKKGREEVSRSEMSFESDQSINKHATKTVTANSGEKGINT